jgi:hypothetical protein
MRCTATIALAATLAAMSPLAMAQASAPDQDHTAHHPAGASAPASTTAAPATKTSEAPAQTNAAMKSMHDMHAKMMAAKTMDERQALMSDHMKAMQAGMNMMGQMKGKKGAMSTEAMSKRMDMMEMMMQMMIDREAARTPVAK